MSRLVGSRSGVGGSRSEVSGRFIGIDGRAAPGGNRVERTEAKQDRVALITSLTRQIDEAQALPAREHRPVLSTPMSPASRSDTTEAQQVALHDWVNIFGANCRRQAAGDDGVVGSIGHQKTNREAPNFGRGSSEMSPVPGTHLFWLDNVPGSRDCGRDE